MTAATSVTLNNSPHRVSKCCDEYRRTRLSANKNYFSFSFFLFFYFLALSESIPFPRLETSEIRSIRYDEPRQHVVHVLPRSVCGSRHARTCFLILAFFYMALVQCLETVRNRPRSTVYWIISGHNGGPEFFAG
jgi:hypothetical protein